MIVKTKRLIILLQTELTDPLIHLYTVLSRKYHAIVYNMHAQFAVRKLKKKSLPSISNTVRQRCVSVI